MGLISDHIAMFMLLFVWHGYSEVTSFCHLWINVIKLQDVIIFIENVVYIFFDSINLVLVKEWQKHAWDSSNKLLLLPNILCMKYFDCNSSMRIICYNETCLARSITWDIWSPPDPAQTRCVGLGLSPGRCSVTL